MKCNLCGNEGARPTLGFHPDCFTQRINQNLGDHSRTVFSGPNVRTESTDGPRTETDWLKFQKDAMDAARLAREQAAEDVRRRQEKAAQDAQQRASQFHFGCWKTYGDFFTEAPKSNPGTYSDGSATESVSVQIDAKRLKQLLLLCHPDKHGNSERSSDVTRWLITIKNAMPTPK